MKNTIFGAIIALIVCACIFSILCVTDVISFNKNNKVNNTDNNTQKDVKETKLCTTSKTLDNNEYKIAIYKVEDGEKNNKIDYLVNNKSIYTYNLDLYKDRVGGIDVFPINTWKECEVYIYDIEDNNHRDIFNIKKINVQGNSKINTEEIESLSKINMNENIFRFSSRQIEENVKENAYIDTVEVKRKIPNTVEIIVTERETKYQLEYGNAFVYIDGNGNILEISNENANLPIIRGYSTAQENIQVGNKLVDEDCNKLLTVEKFLRAAKSNEIYDIITYIDISNDKDYKFELPSKGKVAYLGDETNINDKILTLKEILTREEGKNGQIFINDSNKMPYFRENV